MDTGSSSGADTGADLTADVDLNAPPPRTDLHDPRQRTEVERALCAVPGLLGARLVPGFDRQVDELHILAAVDKQPKQAVRDVQTVLMARFGVPTDHRVISVVQLDESSGPLAAATRVTIDRVAVTRSGLTVQVQVVLRDGGDELVGEAEASSSASGLHRATAQATLTAVAQLLDDHVLELEGTEVADVLGRRVAFSLVQVRSGRTDVRLAGSALVRDAEDDAVARSVLDALNRTIEEA